MAFYDLSTLTSSEIVPGYTLRTIHTGKLSFAYWKVTKDAVMPEHSHLHEQVAHVISGKFELTIEGDIRILEPGIVALIPSNAKHGGRALTECELIDVFYPEREEYKFDLKTDPHEPEFGK